MLWKFFFSEVSEEGQVEGWDILAKIFLKSQISQLLVGVIEKTWHIIKMSISTKTKKGIIKFIDLNVDDLHNFSLTNFHLPSGLTKVITIVFLFVFVFA